MIDLNSGAVSAVMLKSRTDRPASGEVEARGRATAPGQIAKAVAQRLSAEGEALSANAQGKFASAIARGADPEALFDAMLTVPEAAAEGRAPAETRLEAAVFIEEIGGSDAAEEVVEGQIEVKTEYEPVAEPDARKPSESAAVSSNAELSAMSEVTLNGPGRI